MAVNLNPKYVVLHTSIGGQWWKGDVVTVAMLESKGGTVERFLDLGAIREATDEESKLAKVQVIDASTRKGSLEQIVHDKDAEISRLRSRLNEVESDNAELTKQVEAATAPAKTSKK